MDTRGDDGRCAAGCCCRASWRGSCAVRESRGRQTMSGWTLSWENDSFTPPSLSSDESYTNGVRFALQRDWQWTNQSGNVVGPALPAGQPRHPPRHHHIAAGRTELLHPHDHHDLRGGFHGPSLRRAPVQRRAHRDHRARAREGECVPVPCATRARVRPRRDRTARARGSGADRSPSASHQPGPERLGRAAQDGAGGFGAGNVARQDREALRRPRSSRRTHAGKPADLRLRRSDRPAGLEHDGLPGVDRPQYRLAPGGTAELGGGRAGRSGGSSVRAKRVRRRQRPGWTSRAGLAATDRGTSTADSRSASRTGGFHTRWCAGAPRSRPPALPIANTTTDRSRSPSSRARRRRSTGKASSSASWWTACFAPIFRHTLFEAGIGGRGERAYRAPVPDVSQEGIGMRVAFHKRVTGDSLARSLSLGVEMIGLVREGPVRRRPPIVTSTRS
mgnify:CR=1 FL=1